MIEFNGHFVVLCATLEINLREHYILYLVNRLYQYLPVAVTK